MRSPESSHNVILCRQLLIGWLAFAYMVSFSALCIEVYREAIHSGSMAAIIGNLKYLLHG